MLLINLMEPHAKSHVRSDTKKEGKGVLEDEEQYIDVTYKTHTFLGLLVSIILNVLVCK